MVWLNFGIYLNKNLEFGHFHIKKLLNNNKIKNATFNQQFSILTLVQVKGVIKGSIDKLKERET